MRIGILLFVNTKLVKYLQDLNTRFYQQQGESFAATRGAPWHGWKRCIEELLAAGCFQDAQPFTVLDVACGNMRFDDFLQQSLPDTDIRYCGVDNSVEMKSGRMGQNLDVLEALIQGVPLPTVVDAAPADLTVSFGFMHHIPSQNLRLRLLEEMLELTKPGGHVIVSFWQFLNSPELADKAELTHAQALAELGATPPLCEMLGGLEAGDYFLGWQGKAGAYRYCHSFSAEEIDQLIDGVADRAQLATRFDADGRTQNLNGYIILKNCAE